MSPEVLIYVQNIKHYIETNTTAQRFFNVKGNEEAFFDYITELSQKNFEEHGEPELTLDQFEELRKKIHGVPDKTNEATGYFISYGSFGYISLN